MVTNILGISGDFWSAFLNVLGIVGLILIALFIVVFIADWILSTMDGREGIFFKKNRNQVNNTTNITNNYGENYSKPQEKDEFVKTEETVEKVEETTDDKDVDLEKARQEEIALAQEQYNFAQEQEPKEEPVEVVPEEPNYDAMIDEINSTALNAYNKAKSEEFARKVLSGESNEEVEEEPVEEETEEVQEVEEPTEVENTEEVVEETTQEEPEQEVEEVEETTETEEEPVEEEVEETEETQQEVVENTEAQNELLRRLEEQINELKQQLEEQQKENEELKRIAEEEKARLNELIAKRNGDDDDEGRRMIDYVGNLDELEARLEMLKERLKANEKELRINKKEYIPLSRVKKTLESDKKKLRRREEIVAKRKVLLYGVNNYADIDEEKAKELNEELDLLEGLRLSVAHCEEVMEANKDRYPILEHTNKILTETNAQIKADIAEVEEEIEQAKLREPQNNEQND